MRHPTEGVLRRLLDEPAGVATADRRHVATCDECGQHLASIREDADVVHASLATGSRAGADVGPAWQRLSSAASTAGATPLWRAGPRGARARTSLRRPVAATVAVAMALTGAGVAAANDWFQIFRTERIAPVSFSAADLNALPDLRRYGEVALTGRPDVHPVAGRAAAEAETGLDVPAVTHLPRGVRSEPTYQVGGEATVTFTFSAHRAAQAAAAAGRPLPPPPSGMDGSQVRLVAGPGAAALWQKSGVPVLVVGRAVAPRAFSSSGVPFETMRDYLLSLPGLPENVAAQLRTFNADGSTLPLPVPTDRITTSSAQVGGEPATVLATRDRSLAAVTWVQDGLVTVVAGTLDSDEVLSVARGLR